MSGVKLMELEASDMLDVLHFLFEEDFTAVSEDHARSRSAIRDQLYTEMYGVPYTFKMKPPTNARNGQASNAFQYPPDDDFSSLDGVQPVNPRDKNSFEPPAKTKTKFVDAESMPVVIETSFTGLDAPLN